MIDTSGIKGLGTIILQAFQKLPGFKEMFGDAQTLSTLQLIAGILTVIAFTVGVCIAIMGVVKFSVKKVTNERDAVRDGKNAFGFLIGGLTGGAILILLPGILLIIGSVFGSFATAS